MSFEKKMPEDLDALRHVVQVMNEHKRKKTEKLLAVLKDTPLDEGALEAVAMLGPKEANYFLRHHPGHELEQALSSFWNMLDVFQCACKGIQRENAKFAALAKKGEFSHREMQIEIDNIQNDIRKEIFAASGAAFSIVKLSYRVFSKVEVPGYRERIKNEFAEAGDNQFIKCLRNEMSHSWFPPVGWKVFQSIQEGQSVAFEFDCSQLLRYGDFNRIAKEFILASGSGIDVVCLFESYAQKVESLYSWLANVIDDYLPESVHEYRKCVKVQKAYSSRCLWRVLIEQVGIPKKVDPYEHLDRHLTKAELGEVLALPRQSKQQVDRIIQFVDEHDACDDSLRLKVYQLFGVKEEGHDSIRV
ncbi:hypothetical protein [Pseudodesulfovibrio sediminis]|uniref:Uncharacterized protein n=1 Tax=Pseudodesulfovibrio sediminis TaxID=2810563 RepID=A0ABM8HYP8_9BACT|nr:hypothetical protein [Pseudodesulfovibrio sediminis]BCS86826.1 hypothetical protein PSDVSF_00680 [Pseudodesulfovibrio sediminis]